MKQEFSYLYTFILIFTVSYPLLAYALKDLIRQKFILANGVFLLSLAAVSLCFINYLNLVFVAEFGMLFLAFNIYLFILHSMRNLKFFSAIILEFILVFALILGVFVVVADMRDYPMLQTIIERYSYNEYSFKPGFFDEVLQHSFSISFIIVALKGMYHYYQLFRINKQQQRVIKKAQLQKDLVQARLDALQAKVNPHFLYNSLNSIAGLALVDGEKTRQMALALSRFFRYSMNREQTNLINLEDELEMVKTYLEIEKIRFGEKITYTILAEGNTLTLSVPRMLLQPLVENSLKHGLKGECAAISVSIRTELKNGSLVISVVDNGVPFADNFTLGYGLKSIYDKLDLLFPDNYQIEILKGESKEVRIEIYKAVDQATPEK